MDRALQLEPVAPGLHSCLAEILFYAGRYDETVRQCGLTLEMAPSFAGVYGWMGMAHLRGGRTAVAVEALEDGLRQRPRDPRLEALLAVAYAHAGRTDEARACAARLEVLAGERYVEPYFMIWPYAALGDPGAALRWLGRAVEGHSYWMYVLGVDPLVETLRPDPRFARLAERAPLPG
jgi:tetratricopeptide (TPR) repeat protein